MEDLAGRVIVITGAGSGIGAATAIECARAGMDCVINDRNGRGLASLAHTIEALGRRATTIVGDVSQRGLSNRMLDAAERDFGGFDVVFANAGFGIERRLLETSLEEVREIFEVNFFAALDLVRTAAQRLIDQRRPGHLLMCSSCLGKFSYPMFSAYAATKAAQVQVCSSLRAELRPHGIHVSAVCPTVTRTSFFRAISEREGRCAEGDCIPEYCPQLLVHEPIKVARAVVRCLHRPRAEVWTSPLMRAFAAMVTLWPWPLKAAARRQSNSANRRHAATPEPAVETGEAIPSTANVHAARSFTAHQGRAR